MRHDRPDLNKNAIVADLRERGYIWLDVGGPVDGITIGFSHITNTVSACLVEVKNPNGKPRFTQSEKDLKAQLTGLGYHGIYVVATCTEDVLGWFGVM